MHPRRHQTRNADLETQPRFHRLPINYAGRYLSERSCLCHECCRTNPPGAAIGGMSHGLKTGRDAIAGRALEWPVAAEQAVLCGESLVGAT